MSPLTSASPPTPPWSPLPRLDRAATWVTSIWCQNVRLLVRALANRGEYRFLQLILGSKFWRTIVWRNVASGLSVTTLYYLYYLVVHIVGGLHLHDLNTLQEILVCTCYGILIISQGTAFIHWLAMLHNTKDTLKYYFLMQAISSIPSGSRRRMSRVPRFAGILFPLPSEQTTSADGIESFCLTDVGLTSLVRGCKRLEKLSLVWCSAISSTGLVRVAENCKKLTSLDIQVMPCYLFCTFCFVIDFMTSVFYHVCL